MATNKAVTSTNWSPNFSPGRPDGDPLAIVIHHWGVDGQTHNGVVRFLSQDRGDTSTSAHYVASAGEVTQLVHDYDRAWHCKGNNSRTIGIECRPEASDDDYNTVAGLIAAIREEWGWLPLTPHSAHFPTACPGRYTEWLDWLSNKADANGTVQRPSDADRRSGGLAVDGFWGSFTTRALQEYFGVPQDGIISEQLAHNLPYYPAAGTGWEWIGDGDGSQLIGALQAHLGIQADGYAGYDTATSLQNRLGVTADGYVGMATVAALQTRLNEGNL